MKTVTSNAALRALLAPLRAAGKSIALVPTMGNLHAGHISLVEKAGQSADIVVTSLFVNPTQFGANEDLDTYPRTLQADKEKLKKAGNQFLFAPTIEEMYPNGLTQSIVHVPGCTDGLCGGKRPGHFDGVSTIVTKLFHIVQPDTAVFGKKDYQQLCTIKKMVTDLCFPIKIIGVETSREADSLAMSSRNGYLSDKERAKAPALYAVLLQIKTALLAGNRNYESLIKEGVQQIEKKGFVSDYLEIRNASTLQPAEQKNKELVVLVAAFLGNTRLIDNISVILKPEKL